jgi:hypothetical protein
MKPVKVGAEPKKLATLGLLLLVLGYFVYSNFLATDTETAAPRGASASARAAAADGAVWQPPAAAAQARPRASLRPDAQQFRLNFREKDVDPTTADPTLRLDLLAKVQAVSLGTTERNLFQFGAAPLPPAPEPKIIPKPAPQQAAAAAASAEPAKPSDPPKPPPPPITLKFYGYSVQGRGGVKKAFFLDGDDIIVAAEGQLIKNRYKVVRIGVNLVVVEDVQYNHQQTLRLEEQPG